MGYRPPEEFEREANTGVNSAGATMSFFDVEGGSKQGDAVGRPGWGDRRSQALLARSFSVENRG